MHSPVECNIALIDNRILEFSEACATDKHFLSIWKDVEKCFTSDAWISVTNTMKTKRENSLYNCGQCGVLIKNGTTSVICDACLHWIHKNCAGSIPRGSFFCYSCKQC